jgi:hypothetical protein
VISPGDAQNFCLVAAQVIPTLLIAHFLVERNLPPMPPPKWRTQLPALAEQAAQARQSITTHRDSIARARIQLERRWRWRHITGRTARHRQQLAKLDEGSAALDAQSAELDRLEHERTEQEASADYPLLDAWYERMLVLVLSDGLVGESAALLGALRLQLRGHQIVAIFATVAAGAILLMLGLMAQAAWLRFRPGNLNPAGPLLIAGLMAVTGIGIVVAVFFSGSTAKPTPSPTPPRVQIHRAPATSTPHPSKTVRDQTTLAPSP